MPSKVEISASLLSNLFHRKLEWPVGKRTEGIKELTVSFQLHGEGSEISVTYSFDGMLREQRQKHLRELFGFSCACVKCGLRGEALRASEAARAKRRAPWVDKDQV